MPAYRATGVCIRLGTASLADTITHNLTKSSGQVATKNTNDVDEKFRAGVLMKETPVAFPGDNEGLSVNFLGNTPFLQVQTGAEVFVRDNPPESTERQTRRTKSTDTSDEIVAKALFLRVSLSDKSYLRSFDNDQKQNLLIDVFFNGIHTHGFLHTIRETATRSKTLELMFTGLRCERLAERPWIIVPPGQNADGSLRGLRTMPTSKKRWEQISEVLLEEADLRGVNEHAERPPTGAYLAALATMRIPDEVENMQKSSGHRFGIIDVVVVAGTGCKDLPVYLTGPVRMLDSRYNKVPERLKLSDIISRAASQISAEPEPSQHDAEISDDDVDAEGSTDSEYVPRIPTMNVPERPSVQPFLPPAIAYSQSVPPQPASSTSRSRTRASHAIPNPPTVHPTTPNLNLHPPKFPQPQQVDTRQSRTSIPLDRMNITGRDSEAAADMNLNVHKTVPVPPTPEPETNPLAKPTFPPPETRRDSTRSGNSGKMSVQTPMPSASPALSTPVPEAGPKGNGKTTRKGREKGGRKLPAVSKEALLNEDCVIAFGGGGEGGLRQVKSEKRGTFKEEEVVVGMRFFVAV